MADMRVAVLCGVNASIYIKNTADELSSILRDRDPPRSRRKSSAAIPLWKVIKWPRADKLNGPKGPFFLGFLHFSTRLPITVRNGLLAGRRARLSLCSSRGASRNGRLWNVALSRL